MSPGTANKMAPEKIAVDAMGGDFAPEIVVQGAVLAARDYHIPVLLVGDEEKIRKELEKNDGLHLPIEVHHAPEVIEMGEEPYHMIRKKKRSSLRLAFELVKQNEAQGLVSAGNSGAVVYGALFVLKRIKHINRPGIATVMPSVLGTVMVIDAGANTICKPRNLVQFALMGSVFCTHMFGLHEPRIGVLSNGEEETKGTDLTRITNDLLKKSPLNYVGYVEGRDVFSGNVDVVVCDGFVGNVLLKVSEGIHVSAGELIGTISKNDMLLLRADVPQQYVESISEIVTCNIRTAYSEKVFSLDDFNGSLITRGSSVAENNHYIPVYFKVINEIYT